MSKPVILVLSHLRWGFVYQRPQHLLSRLAAQWQVLYVEEPVHGEGPARLEIRQVGPGLTLLVPHTPVAAPGFCDEQITVVQELLESWLKAQAVHVDVTWLYTPLALPLAQALSAGCLVYDCMDELASFKNAPAQLRLREDVVMQTAALVLTGGPSLFQARYTMNPNVHCLPSAVDAKHYAAANLKPDSPHALEAERLQGHLARPRVGFFGVIDERLDLSLIEAVADAHPEWHLVMAGPVVKIDPATLPQRSNIVWLGMQPYERLPHLLAGWDLCLMPFALNEATRFISPTKTLEYMAGDKPVVSTPVHDVIALYGSAVEVAYGGARDFVDCCEKVLAERGASRYEREREMLAAVSTYSWDRSAKGVNDLLLMALAATRQATLGTPLPSSYDLGPASAERRPARRAPVSAHELRLAVSRDGVANGSPLPVTA